MGGWCPPVVTAGPSGLVSAVIYRDLGLKRLNDAIVHAGLATGVVLSATLSADPAGDTLAGGSGGDAVTDEAIDKIGAINQFLRQRTDERATLPEALAPHREALKDSTVVSFCTGGIRCEKAALWMVNDGMDNVLQLDGGILGYFEEVGGEGYEGRCFVFDERVALDAELKPMVDQPLPEPRPSAF